LASDERSTDAELLFELQAPKDNTASTMPTAGKNLRLIFFMFKEYLCMQVEFGIVSKKSW
jgi:hypothetical protein